MQQRGRQRGRALRTPAAGIGAQTSPGATSTPSPALISTKTSAEGTSAPTSTPDASSTPNASNGPIRDSPSPGGVSNPRMARNRGRGAALTGGLGTKIAGKDKLSWSATDWNYVDITNQVRRNAQSLRTLELVNCSQTNDALIKAIVPNLRNLRSLNLWGCVQLTDASLLDLANVATLLTTLKLTGVLQLSDRVVSRFGEKCAHLKRLDLTNCPKVTSASVRTVLANNPGLMQLTPSILRAIPQDEEVEPDKPLREQLAPRRHFEERET